MKKIFVVLIAAAGFMACKSGDKKADATVTKPDSTGKNVADPDAHVTAPIDTANLTSIQWLDSTYLDLGKQKEGKQIEVSYRFKNTGTKNLVIASVSAQCGCTIPEKPEKPFAPGEEGVIKAKYNGSGHGETRKEIYVTANTNPDKSTLTFRADLEQ